MLLRLQKTVTKVTEIVTENVTKVTEIIILYKNSWETVILQTKRRKKIPYFAKQTVFC